MFFYVFLYNNAQYHKYKQRTKLTPHPNHSAYTGQSNMQEKVKGKVYSCAGIEALHRLSGP